MGIDLDRAVHANTLPVDPPAGASLGARRAHEGSAVEGDVAATPQREGAQIGHGANDHVDLEQREELHGEAPYRVRGGGSDRAGHPAGGSGGGAGGYG